MCEIFKVNIFFYTSKEMIGKSKILFFGVDSVVFTYKIGHISEGSSPERAVGSCGCSVSRRSVWAWLTPLSPSLTAGRHTPGVTWRHQQRRTRLSLYIELNWRSLKALEIFICEDKKRGDCSAVLLLLIYTEQHKGKYESLKIDLLSKQNLSVNWVTDQYGEQLHVSRYLLSVS